MTYRIMLLVELTKLSDMSDNLVVISLYNLVLVGNLLTNGTSELPYFTKPQPASAFVIYPICSVEIFRSVANFALSGSA